ncbi:MAG: RNA-binding protein [Cyanobacteria bacterium SZAS LIN-2]|nr:RNA-binding protein [Cyanobacteria bacterium SZAS LIN-2]
MSTRILVGNVPVDATEEELKEFFSAAGQVRKVIVPRNDKGKGKGFASIVMATRQEAISAESTLANSEFRGRKLSISLMQEQIKKESPGLFSFLRRFTT